MVPLLLLLAVAGCQSAPPAQVITDRADALSLPLPKDEDAFHFVVYGDRTGGPASGIEILAQAVEETNLLDPDLVMTVGDLVQGYNESPAWLEQMREYRSTMADLRMPWYPVAGNHDIYWFGSETPPGHHEANYEAHFGPLWYWFPHKNAAFIVLYTDEGDRQTNGKGFVRPKDIQMSEEQLAWLKQTLAETSRFDHVFVFLHHPRWITTTYPDSNWEEAHSLLVEAGNVSTVFAGHFHRQRYEGRKDGILYYVLATVGGAMPMDVPGTGWLNHMDLVTVRPDRIEIATIPVGTLIDPKTMTPARQTDIDKARQLPITRLSDPIELGTDGAAAGVAAYRIENKAARAIEVTATGESPAGDWWLRPDHVHVALQPGESADLTLQFQRPPDGFRAGFSAPALTLQVDYLSDDRRVSLPAQRKTVFVRPQPMLSAEESQGKNRALILDADGAALLLAPDAFRLDPGPFTLEAWVRANDTTGERTILGKTKHSGFILLLVEGRPFFAVHLGGVYRIARGRDEDIVAPGAWHHIAGVYDGAELRLYLDGRLISATAGSGFPTANELPALVGANPDGTGQPTAGFLGAIDELRVSSTARYKGEEFTPSKRHEPDSDTHLLLHLDEQGPPFAYDASVHRRHAIGMGGIRFEPLDGEVLDRAEPSG